MVVEVDTWAAVALLLAKAASWYLTNRKTMFEIEDLRAKVKGKSARLLKAAEEELEDKRSSQAHEMASALITETPGSQADRGEIENQVRMLCGTVVAFLERGGSVELSVVDSAHEVQISAANSALLAQYEERERMRALNTDTRRRLEGARLEQQALLELIRAEEPPAPTTETAPPATPPTDQSGA